jgi:pimeloyl-ACP methyl ester carboxylesterase
VHGAWADASSWNGVVRKLQHDEYQVVAPANPLRSLSGDSDYLADYLATLHGPIIMVGHSYGGAVITNAATGDSDVRGLVYINGDAPDEGQGVASLAGPDSALTVADPTTVFDFVPATLPPTPLSDLYLKVCVHLRVRTGLSARQAAVLAATSAQQPLAP